MTDSDKDNITNEETANVEDAATDVAVETSEDQSTETSNDVESEESSQEAVIEDDSPVSSISLEENLHLKSFNSLNPSNLRQIYRLLGLEIL